MNSQHALRLGIFLFDRVEVLDFCGPLEVFGCANDEMEDGSIDIFTVSESAGVIDCSHPLTVKPDFTFETVPAMNVLVIPGGMGTRPLLDEEPVIEWIRQQSRDVDRLLSVCTGSLLLAKAGLLDGKKATTHHGAMDLLRDISPRIEVRPGDRVVDNGRIICSAGIAAGIDMSLYVVEQIYGPEIARQAAQRMEYPFRDIK